jgi:hypothetical protein
VVCLDGSEIVPRGAGSAEFIWDHPAHVIQGRARIGWNAHVILFAYGRLAIESIMGPSCLRPVKRLSN